MALVQVTAEIVLHAIGVHIDQLGVGQALEAVKVALLHRLIALVFQ